MKQIEYKIVNSTKLSLFIETVNLMLSQGWQAQGGVCVTDPIDGSATRYVQAMVKIEEKTL